MLKLSRLLWIVLLACAFLALDTDRAEAREGLASWYGPGFRGLPTASGEPFDPQGYTAAHKTLPFGTDLVVNYRGRSVAVTVNDRGPYVGARELDLSRAAARDIGLTRVGVD
jgi:rare lipoprotein A